MCYKLKKPISLKNEEFILFYSNELFTA